ncbi:MAG TPA: hypothetical protein VIM16_14650 [Mucilaginibacter sp.]|jgi:hypothetical protein
MKKIIRILMLLSIVSLFAVTNTKAQEIVVGVRPVHPRLIRRTFRPSPRHVWVSEEWTPVGGTYVYHAGYWALPPRPGTIWVAGHWRHRHRGYIWVGGFWR